MTEKNDTKLLDQKEALSFYVDSLLGILPDKEEIIKAVLSDDVNKMTDIAHHSTPVESKNNTAVNIENNDVLNQSNSIIETRLYNEEESIDSEPEKTDEKDCSEMLSSVEFSQQSEPLIEVEDPQKQENTIIVEESAAIIVEESAESAENIQTESTESELMSENSPDNRTAEISLTIEDENGELQELNIKPRLVEKTDLNQNLEIKEDFTSATEKTIHSEEPVHSAESSTTNFAQFRESIEPTINETCQDEAPSIDLSLLLPKVPSDEEIEAIENKKLLIEHQELKQEYLLKEQENIKLKTELNESLKAIEELSREQLVDYSPQWANPSFQAMIFSIAGLKLALPLKDLDNIIVWDKKYLTEMPGHAPWYLGLVQHRGKTVPVIDTIQQVVPPHKIAAVDAKREGFRNIIMINNERWGLACEKIIGITTLQADAVKWRSDLTRRRWLLGTVKEHMCALLDSLEFSRMLETGDDSLVAKN